MCITAYSSTYLKMSSEEMSAENSETVIKSLGGQVICLRLLIEIWCITPCQISWLLLVYHEACHVVVQCNTPGLLTPNMLAKIYDHKYRTRVPSTQSWLLRHYDWTWSYIVWEQIDGWLRMGLLPPPREFCRHILSCRELKAKSFKRCLHSVLRGVSL